MEHGLNYIMIHVQKHIAALAMCYYNPPLVRENPLGATAFVKLVYWTDMYYTWLTWWYRKCWSNIYHVYTGELNLFINVPDKHCTSDKPLSIPMITQLCEAYMFHLPSMRAAESISQHWFMYWANGLVPTWQQAITWNCFIHAALAGDELMC